MRVVLRYAPAAWAVGLAVLMLGPALGRGYVLTYDMVWVPDLALRHDFLGLGTALPRAVPSDAVVAVLDAVVPGMLLQKVVLLGGLVLGGLGAIRLAGRSTVARLVAVSAYVWTPFVVERLWIGHWPLLLCWAVLPWLVVHGARIRDDGRLGAALPFLLLVGSLSANAGLMSALVLLAVGLTRRGAVRMVLAVVAANAPWVVAGVLHLDSATSSAAGGVFGVNAEGSLPTPLSALTLGGIWNAEVVPGSRTGFVLPLVLAGVLVAAAVVGWSAARERLGRRTTDALLALWLLGYGLAMLSWAAPGTVGGLAGHLPGGGLLRDGGRFLALCAPLTAVLMASGAEWLASRWRERAPRVVVGVAGALLPLALMPDAAWGIGGDLSPATYPDDYGAARAALTDPPPGDLLVLPFISYRAPTWNDDRKVLDPLPRYLQPDYVVNDQLAVDGRLIAGEDPRVPAVLAALQEPDARARAVALGRLGIGVVARETDVATTPEYDAPVAGTAIFHGSTLDLVRIDAPVDVRHAPTTWVVALSVAWGAFLLLLLTGMWNVFQLLSTGLRTRRGAG
jgi:hypothetical protein